MYNLYTKSILYEAYGGASRAERDQKWCFAFAFISSASGCGLGTRLIFGKKACLCMMHIFPESSNFAGYDGTQYLHELGLFAY